MSQKMIPWNTIRFTKPLCELLQFYLFETPVEGTSRRGRTFKEIGWVGSSRFQMLERLLLESSDIEKQNWMFKEIDEIEALAIIKRTDIQYMVSSRDKGKIRSMIYAIRNAFAHGSFSQLDNGWYLFENHYKGKLKARIVIAESTLFEWKKIIESKPEHFTKKKKKKSRGNAA